MINDIHKKHKESNIIKVDFRKGKLSIDDDSYLNRVTKIHCRLCLKQKNRNGAMELHVSWGYVCSDCQDKIITSKAFKSEDTADNDETNRNYSTKASNK